MGGEYGGGVLMALETAPVRKQGFFTSLVHIGTPAGVLVPVALVTLLTTYLPEGAYDAWAWRLPFLLSIVLIGVGIFIRLRISESPEFAAARAQRQVVKVPIRRVLATYPGTAVLSILAKIAESGLFNIYYVVIYYVVAIAIAFVTTTLGLPRTPILIAVLIGCLVECFTLPLFGRLSDRVGRRPVYIGGIVFQILLAVPLFLMLETGDFWLTTLALTLGLAVGHGSLYGAQGALFANLYPVELRYTGLSLTQQVGATLGGGLAPLLGASLLDLGHGGWGYLLVYVFGVAVLSGLATLGLKRGESRDSLTQSFPVVDASVREGVA